MVASRQNPGVLWSHNDSGGTPTLFAMSFGGADLGTYEVPGVRAEDWEDIALGPAPELGDWYLYVGDTGTNTRTRDYVEVHRILEPEVELGQRAGVHEVDRVGSLRIRFPDSSPPDGEALLVDPRDGDLYLIPKSEMGELGLYRATAAAMARREILLEHVGTVRMPETGFQLVTAGDISPDGAWILLRTYLDVYLWPRQPGQSVAEALTREPCFAPRKAEPQGESIAWVPSGQGYFTMSEGDRSPIYFFERLR